MDGGSLQNENASFATRLHTRINDPIAKESRALIAELEKKFEAELGIKILIGMEKECKIHYKAGDKSRDCNDELFVGAIADKMRSARDKVSKQLGKENITSPIGGFFREDKEDQYEMITMPAQPLHAVHRIDAQCQQLEKIARSGEKIEHNGNGYTIKHLNFLPVTGTNYDQTTSGLHVNISVWDKAYQFDRHSA